MARADLAIEFLIAAGVGLKASESTAWANSISDILSNDTFSIVVKDRDEYKFDGSAYWRDEDPSEIYNVGRIF